MPAIRKREENVEKKLNTQHYCLLPTSGFLCDFLAIFTISVLFLVCVLVFIVIIHSAFSATDNIQ